MCDMFERAIAQGRIAPAIPVEHLVSMMAVMFDGLLMRRAIDPALNTEAIARITMQTIQALVEGGAAPAFVPEPEMKLEPAL